MAKRNLSNTRNKFVVTIMFMIMVILSTVITVVVYIVSKYLGGPDYSEALAGSVGAGMTLIGAFLIIYQLGAEKKVTCSQMLSDLNFRFIENERLMKLYSELEHAYKDPTYHLVIDNNDPNKVHDNDLMGYLTFYETLNEYVDNGVLEIGQMNDLFGDRFFKLIHNIDIQEKELYSEPSSYVNIFELYGKWINYRTALEKKGLGRLNVRNELAVPYLYVKQRTYLKETSRVIIEPHMITLKDGSKYLYRRLFPRDFQKCQELQNGILEELKNSGNSELFYKTLDDEFYESFLIDYTYGLFDGDKLIALAIIVFNRNTSRNIVECIPSEYNANFKTTITFDTIQVDAKYRKKGIQQFFLAEADRIAKELGIKHIVATVSDKNIPSKHSFEKNGYKIVDTRKMYENLDRDIILKEIK